MKAYSLLNYLSLILLSWFGINAIFSNYSFMINHGYKIRIFLELLLLIQSIKAFGFSLILKRKKVILSIWLLYLILFTIHVLYSYPILTKIFNLNYTGQLWFYTIDFLCISTLVSRCNFDIYDFVKKYIAINSVLSLIIIVQLLQSVGFDFISMEATVFSGNVTIITLSYYLVQIAVFSLFLLVDKSRRYVNMGRFCFVLSFILILMLGKRGALLSVVGPCCLIYLIANKTWKQTVLYSCLGIVIYWLIILNIDSVFDFMSIFSKRLAETSKVAYYLGDNNGRDDIWEYAIEQINKGLIWGTYPKLFTPYSTSFMYGLHPHNIWLESLMTMGLVGSIPFFLYVIYIAIRKMYVSIKKYNKYAVWGILFIAEFIHGCFSSTLYESPIILCMFILATMDNKKILKWK